MQNIHTNHPSLISMIFVDFVLGLVLGLMVGSILFILLGFYHSKFRKMSHRKKDVPPQKDEVKKDVTPRKRKDKRFLFQIGNDYAEFDPDDVIPVGVRSYFSAKDI